MPVAGRFSGWASMRGVPSQRASSSRKIGWKNDPARSEFGAAGTPTPQTSRCLPRSRSCRALRSGLISKMPGCAAVWMSVMKERSILISSAVMSASAEATIADAEIVDGDTDAGLAEMGMSWKWVSQQTSSVTSIKSGGQPVNQRADDGCRADCPLFCSDIDADAVMAQKLFDEVDRLHDQQHQMGEFVDRPNSTADW